MTDRQNQFLKNLNPQNNTFNNNLLNTKSQINANTQLQSLNDKLESDKVFLERTHVKSILDVLLDSLCKNQPDDPINYICNYFEGLNQQEDLLGSALERLKIINYSSPVFDDCILSLYNTLNKIIKTNNNKKNTNKIQIGEMFNNIIDTITTDIPQEIRENFFKIIKKRDYDAISFEILRSSIKIICIFKEYINQCKGLFKQLESYSNCDKINKMLCLVLLQQLSNAFEIISPNNKNNQITIESIYELSPSALIAVLEEKYEKSLAKSISTINLNEFLNLASQVFFKQISNNNEVITS